ncbi:MAG TPA: hypothetical protein VE977_08110, partial [Pyrinomonadaceae bacterium]|nr:hypothetical protein [Pyrinomonadaceae bacterium]
MSSCESHDSKEQSDSVTETVLRILQEGSVAVVATLIEAANAATSVGAKLIIADPGATDQTVGSLGDEALDRAVIAYVKLLDSRTDTRVFQVKELAPELTE